MRFLQKSQNREKSWKILKPRELSFPRVAGISDIKDNRCRSFSRQDKLHVESNFSTIDVDLTLDKSRPRPSDLKQKTNMAPFTIKITLLCMSGDQRCTGEAVHLEKSSGYFRFRLTKPGFFPPDVSKYPDFFKNQEFQIYPEIRHLCI